MLSHYDHIVRNYGFCISRRSKFICVNPILIPSSEKIIKLDAKKRQYDIVVIGEESHVAYNRVGLTSFFEHREVEQLYLNPKEWVSAKDYKKMFPITNTFCSTGHSRMVL